MLCPNWGLQGVGYVIVGVWSPVPTDPPQFDLIYTAVAGDAAEGSPGELSVGKAAARARLQLRHVSLWDRFVSSWTTRRLVGHISP